MKRKATQRPRYAPPIFKYELSTFDLVIIAFALLLGVAAWWLTESAARPDVPRAHPAQATVREARPDSPLTAAPPQRDTVPVIRPQPVAPGRNNAPPTDMLAALERAHAAARQNTASVPLSPHRNLTPEAAARHFEAAVQSLERPSFGLSNSPFWSPEK